MDEPAVLTEEEQEVYSRWQLAMQLRDKQDWAEATKHYVWLWQNIPLKYPDMSAYGLRTRNLFIFNDMRMVLANYPQARSEFEKLRDDALEDAKKNSNRDDWVALNSMLGHDDDTLTWFDSCKHEVCPCDFVPFEVRKLEELLLARHRLADLVFTYPEPIKKIDALFQSAQEYIFNQGCRPGEQADDLFPEEAERIYAAYLAAGAWETADQIANRALELRSGIEMRKALMRAMLNQRCPQRELKSTAELPEGAAQLLRHHIDQGIQDLTRAIESSPDYACAYKWRGWGFARRFQFDLAVNDFSRAIELNPQDPFAYCGRGRALFELQKLTAAIEDLDESIRCDATNSEAYFARATCYDATGDYGQSVLDLDQSVKLRGSGETLDAIDKRDSEYLRDSSVYGRRNIIDEITRLDLLIKLECPNLDRNFIKRAECNLQLNQIDAAVKDLEAAQTLKPNEPKIVLQKVSALLRIGKLSEALAAANKAIEAEPLQAAGYLARADAQRKAGDYELAVADLTKVIDSGGELAAQAYFNRARAHEKLGHADSAQKDAQTAATMGYTGAIAGTE